MNRPTRVLDLPIKHSVELPEGLATARIESNANRCELRAFKTLLALDFPRKLIPGLIRNNYNLI